MFDRDEQLMTHSGVDVCLQYLELYLENCWYQNSDGTVIVIRGGPLDIWGGGWAITKKKFAHKNNPEKKYRAQQTYWKKKSSKD
jgi:hypothetical protein